MENQDIDKMFNEAGKIAEENTNFPSFEKVWSKVENKLDTKEKKKSILPFLPYGIAAGLALTFGVWYFTNDTYPTIQNNVANNDTSVSQPSKENIVATKEEDSLKKMYQEYQSKPNEIIAYESTRPTPTVAPDIMPVHEMHSGVTSDYVAPPPPPVSASPNAVRRNEIEAVQIVGYKVAKKESLVASTTTINSLNGSVQGVTVSPQNNSIRIRGAATMPLASETKYIDEAVVLGYGTKRKTRNNSNDAVLSEVQNSTSNLANQPLYVINGVPYEDLDISKIDQSKVKKVHVLKAEAATSLYGVKGQNGVVIIEGRKLKEKDIQSLKRVQIPVEQDNEEYDQWQENQFESVKNEPLSTFSIDVDKAAYSNIRRMINNGQKVDKNAVRIEEMINYFKYDYPQPKNNDPFSINTEYGANPWNPKHQLLKIGLQGLTLDESKLPASNLVFLIDVSGSMNSANKLPLLKSSFRILLDKLRPQDKVTVVTYAGSAGVVLKPTSASKKEIILQAIDKLGAGGSTAGAEGIETAYKLAKENFIKNGNNRVILATDGDFNVGISDNNKLEDLIVEKRKSGIFLTCLGFGMGNYKDNRLEMLANKGNGNYAYIDNLQESNKFLGKEFAGSMYAIAKDVKIQIEFNPKYVQSYRLIGYENRKLRNEDFVNDKIDAGELGIGHTVTAIYEVIPTGVKSDFSPQNIPLKYSQNSTQISGSDELATVKFRYKKPDEDVSKEIVHPIKNQRETNSQTSADFKFASAVSWFGLVLRDSKLITNKNLTEIATLAKQGKSNDEEGYRTEFVRLVETYQTTIK